MLLVLVPTVVLLLAAAAVSCVDFHRPGQRSDRFRLQIASQAQSILENSPVIANLGMAAHQHDPGAPNRVMCAVDPFGTDPPNATEPNQVRVVYAQHLCVIAPAGLAWDGAPKSAGPVVVNLDDGSVWVPQANRDYRTQVREKIPAQYLNQAFGAFAHPDVVAQLRQRYTRDVAHAG